VRAPPTLRRVPSTIERASWRVDVLDDDGMLVRS
jgi:hypothetical protein